MLGIFVSGLSLQGSLVARTRAAPARGAVATMAHDVSDPYAFTLGVLGDLHMDPRDLDDSFEGRGHIKAVLDASPRPYVCSLGDLGESKDCTQTQQLFAGTTPCFELVRHRPQERLPFAPRSSDRRPAALSALPQVKDFLDGFGHPYEVVGGNHDLEGIDEFRTDEENLEAYLRIMGAQEQTIVEIVPRLDR